MLVVIRKLEIVFISSNAVNVVDVVFFVENGALNVNALV